jgi:ABC-2 type transport system permease protein
MSGWRSVARKEFRDAVRSRRLLVLVVLFVLFVVGVEYAVVGVLGDASSVTAVVGTLVGPTTLLVPLVGLFSGYRCVAGERESGTHRLLFSLPHSRADVVVGKVVGRTLVVWLAVLAGFLAGVLTALVLLGGVDVVPLVAYLAVSLLYAAAFVGLGVGISAATGSTNVAVVASVGAFGLFQFLWPLLVDLARRHLLPGAPESLYEALTVLSPLVSYATTLFAYVGAGLGRAGSTPYQQGWFGLLVLAAWVVVPPALGYLRFRGVDL